MSRPEQGQLDPRGFKRLCPLCHGQAQLALQAGQSALKALTFLVAAWHDAECQHLLEGFGIAAQLFQHAHLAPARLAEFAALIDGQRGLQLAAFLQVLSDVKQLA
ncbi:hypothetical protein SSTU70S_03693 [Stutzerimonas stutzeri]